MPLKLNGFPMGIGYIVYQQMKLEFFVVNESNNHWRIIFVKFEFQNDQVM